MLFIKWNLVRNSVNCSYKPSRTTFILSIHKKHSMCAVIYVSASLQSSINLRRSC